MKYSKNRHIIVEPGARFANWTVIEFSHRKDNGHLVWRCLCDCGEVRLIVASALKCNLPYTCRLKKPAPKWHSDVANATRTRAYSSWRCMLNRCYDPKNNGYHLYGARGITVCDRWRDSFAAFLSDMGEPAEGYSLNRIDNAGPYVKENCNWADIREQSRNRRTNRLITFNGRTKCLKDWAKELGMDPSGLANRLRHWTIEKALTEPVRKTVHRRKATQK